MHGYGQSVFGLTKLGKAGKYILPGFYDIAKF